MTHRSRESTGTAREADAGSTPPELPVREILAAAARTGWRHRQRTLAVAVAVSAVTAVMEFVANHLTDQANVPLLVFTALSASGVSVLGTVFLSGFLCRHLGGRGRGRTAPGIWQGAGRLPVGRLRGAPRAGVHTPR